MDVGIGLPNAVRGVDRGGIVDWAQRAERAGFSSLGTIDSLSRGRLTLGLPLGGREDDYEASGVDFHPRGRIFDRQLDGLAAVWAESAGSDRPRQTASAGPC